MFGNPGSTEEGLLDEVSHFPDIDYVLGLQEAALVCMADGYAQATQRPAVVQLHSASGSGTPSAASITPSASGRPWSSWPARRVSRTTPSRRICRPIWSRWRAR